MKLPDAVPVSPDALRAIAARHGVDDEPVLVPSIGIINTTYAAGPIVIRIPRDHAAHIDQARAEAAALPFAAGAGVRVPRLLDIDESLAHVPVPYLVLERLTGVDLETREPLTTGSVGVWWEVGRELARLHGADPSPSALTEPSEDLGDPRALAELRAREGWISPLDAAWIGEWLERLAPAAAEAGASRVVHGDLQRSNVFVDRSAGEYVALLDWGCARRDDPATDFLPVPLEVVPHLLAGHRELAPVEGDDTVEARILWGRLQMALAILPRGAVPGRSWAERPLAWLLDLLRFFADPPSPEWRALRPPPR